MINPFIRNKRAEEEAKQIIINEIKQQVEGGVKMRNDEEPAEAPTISEREINLTLINDKLNYIINLFNKVAKKEGIDLAE